MPSNKCLRERIDAEVALLMSKLLTHTDINNQLAASQIRESLLETFKGGYSDGIMDAMKEWNDQ